MIQDRKARNERVALKAGGKLPLDRPSLTVDQEAALSILRAGIGMMAMTRRKIETHQMLHHVAMSIANPDLLPAEIIKVCSNCGDAIGYYDWVQLQFCGVSWSPDEALEYRNCECGSTLTVDVAIQPQLGEDGNPLTEGASRDPASASWIDYRKFPDEVGNG